MKIGTTELLKFKRLQGRLRLSHWQAIGLLEALWLFTSKNAPAGDIGRHTNEDIAFGIEWFTEADALIDTLIECGWIDRDETHRLVIHHWADHVPNWLKANFAKHGKQFAGNSTKQTENIPEQATEGGVSNLLGGVEQVTKQATKDPTKQPAQVGSVSCSGGLSTLPPRHVTSRHDNSSNVMSGQFTDEALCCTSTDVSDFLVQWHQLPTGKCGVVHVAGWREGMPPIISPKDREALETFWPCRKEAALEAMKAIQEGALQWNTNGLKIREFANQIDALCARQSKVHQKPDPQAAALKQMMDDLGEYAFQETHTVTIPTQATRRLS